MSSFSINIYYVIYAKISQITWGRKDYVLQHDKNVPIFPVFHSRLIGYKLFTCCPSGPDATISGVPKKYPGYAVTTTTTVTMLIV